jgi:hypothetical protein
LNLPLRDAFDVLAQMIKQSSVKNPENVIKLFEIFQTKKGVAFKKFLSKNVTKMTYFCFFVFNDDEKAREILHYFFERHESTLDTACQYHDVGTTPLHWASEMGLPVCVLILLKGTDPNVTKDGGLTPLHCASHIGHPICVRLLLESRANPNVMDEDGYTPLHAASLRSHPDCMRLLLNFQADPYIKNKSGETALDIAKCKLSKPLDSRMPSILPDLIECIQILNEFQNK